MDSIYIKYKKHSEGPFSIEDLEEMHLRRSMQFSHHPHSHWKSKAHFPEIIAIYKQQQRRKWKKWIPWLVSIFIILCLVPAFYYNLKQKDTPIGVYPQKQQVNETKPVPPTSIPKKVKKKTKKETRKDTPPLTPITQISVSSLPAENEAELNISSNETHKKYIRNHISEFIKTNRSSFFYNENTGIQEVSAVVENMSEFVLDELTIRADYLTPEREPVYSEFIVFENVAPYRIIRKKAPPKANCRYVMFFIVSIKSKALSLYFTPERASATNSDPFYYKP